MKKLKFFIMIVCCSTLVFGQNVDLPQRHQRSLISQKMGLAKVTIEYSSPSANNRVLFGNVIPFDEMWGAGERENTTIEFSHDVSFQGEKINAGKYGLYMIPGKENFKIILSKYNESFSSTFPKENEIVLDVTSIPVEIPKQEWLKYDFIDRNGWGTTAVMDWEKTRIPFKIEVLNTDLVLFESLKSELKGRGQFLWGANYDAANFLEYKNIHLETAMQWVDASLELEKEAGWRRGASLWLKSKLIIKKDGYNEEAKKYMHEAIQYINNPFDLNNAIYTLLNNKDTKLALEGAKRLTTEFSDHSAIWMFTDTLAEVYLKSGNKSKALKYYNGAKAQAPKNQSEYYRKKIAEIENAEITN